MEIARGHNAYGVGDPNGIIDTLLNDPTAHQANGPIRLVVPDVPGVVTPTSLAMTTNNPQWGVKIVDLEHRDPAIRSSCDELARCFSHDPQQMTCYAFLARRPGTACFGVHEDEEHVFLHILEGEKDLIVANQLYRLGPGDQLFIPSGTPHQPINRRPSRMLSFGFHFPPTVTQG